MYSIYKGRKSNVVERFIRILKNNLYQYMTSVLKYVYIDKLDDIVNKCNSKYCTKNKMKTVDVKSSTYVL